MNELTAIQKGDESAFISVYYQYHQRLFRFFLKRVNVQETARELTQESFVKLWKSRHTLSAVYSTENQLFTIASTILVDHFRRKALDVRRLSALRGRVNADQEFAYTSQARAFESADYLKAIARDLPPVRKKVFLLKVRSGYSNKEIATELSIALKTVEDHMTKALKHIRSILTFL